MSASRVTSELRRGLARAAWLVACAAILAPIWLGPALGSVIALLGAHMEHHCACGMVRGKCGCEECALEEAERHDRAPSRVPVWKTSCTDDGVAVDGSLPPTVGPAPQQLAPAAPPPREGTAPIAFPSELASRGAVKPPTPPPRSRVV
ncbi:MAG: hypothetical protein U0235_15430 [Polyangiaceae bacterium]